ncbi:MHYT domain-containing protein [Actinoplanes sp. NPDC051494]|uniref:MHYT domain-containing protein n=1 Tax=Actinoplanes sp. NPDC051494 TaxID=3363907 RepID=UPI0037A65CEB
MEVHHFQHGWVTPAISYALSVLGSLLGLVCAIRLRQAATTGARAWWLTLSAVAIGGTGIWTMHFVAMLGFGVVGTTIKYDVPLTAASAVLAVAAVGAGLLIVFGGTRGRPVRIVIGGVLAGLGVAAMHYMGMAAMHLNGGITYGPGRVAASIAIAVVAATAALWLAATVSRPAGVLGAALIMGIAVNGMHFTGMSAMTVHAHRDDVVPTGASGTSLLVPIGLTVVFGLVGLLYALMATPNDEDRAAAEYLAARRQAMSPPVQAAAPAPADTRIAGRPTGTFADGEISRTSGDQGPRGSALGAGSWTYRDREQR